MLAPTLETKRLILRQPSAEDFEAYAAFSAIRTRPATSAARSRGR